MDTTGLTCDRIRYLLSYDSSTGVFVWKHPQSNRVAPNSVAGSASSPIGYLRLGIDGKLYFAHRLAWLYVYGHWPDGEIDHIDGDRLNNRIDNLRIVNRRENSRNMTCHRLGKLPGCSKYGNMWKATYYAEGAHHFVGLYSSEQEAHEAYMKACEELT